MPRLRVSRSGWRVSRWIVSRADDDGPAPADCATLLPADFPGSDDLPLDRAVVAFAAFVTGLAGIDCGLIPALRIRRLDLVSSLAENGSTPLGAGNSSQPVRARLLLMIGQVAAASLLLVGPALLGRSFVGMLQADRGFDPGGVLTARLPLPEGPYTRNGGTLYSRRCWNGSPERRESSRRHSPPRRRSRPAARRAHSRFDGPTTARPSRPRHNHAS